jgi:hemerythrin-like domain-containing protein
MQSIKETLSTDHHRCDEIFAETEALISQGNWDQGGARFEDFREAMEHHFAMEENVLFPDFEQRSGQSMGPTQVMRGEHAQMRELLEDMRSNIERQERDAFLGLSETLLVIMQQHNAKEEQILYPMADQLLGNSVPDVIDRMEAVDVCHG